VKELQVVNLPGNQTSQDILDVIRIWRAIQDRFSGVDRCGPQSSAGVGVCFPFVYFNESRLLYVSRLASSLPSTVRPDAFRAHLACLPGSK
jgi:hypothetical protein